MSTKRSLETKEVSSRCSEGVSYEMFLDIPEDMQILGSTERGTSVWVAGLPRSHKFILRRFHDVGVKKFPFGGYTLWDPKNDQCFDGYYDSAVIHPDNFKRPRKPKKKTVKKKAATKKSTAKKTTTKK
jgi:hypothetical protein